MPDNELAPGDFLERMAGVSAQRVQHAKSQMDLGAMRELSRERSVVPLALHEHAFNIIAEIKMRSPSTGGLSHENHDYVAQAIDYALNGAAAISVLTEPSEFGGSMTHLAACADAVGIPVMRKDFLVDPYQVYEAKAHGASGVLLIVRMVDDALLDDLLDTVAETGMFTLIEAFDESDLDRCHSLKGRRSTWGTNWLLGLNCRDLATLDIVPQRFEDLCLKFPDGTKKVAESGLQNSHDVCCVADQGYDLALIGSALMQAPDPGGTLRSMLNAGRSLKT